MASILERIMPMATPSVFASVKEMEENGNTEFVHYFVAAEVLLSQATFFLERSRKTIVLVQGAEVNRIPREFRTLDCRQSEEQLTHSLVRLAGMAHGKHHAHPIVAQTPAHTTTLSKATDLTQRELDVLRLVTRGYINKEIADHFYVSRRTAETAFKKGYGMTIHEYVLRYRLEQAKMYLSDYPDLTLSALAQMLGFCDEHHLSRSFSKACGISPREYRKQKSSDR
jgi:AraC-like DNA-binding protein